MSNLTPGGSRGKSNRIFDPKGIARVCQSKHHVDHGSIADKPHTHSREQARRLRQAAKKESK